MTVAAAVHDEQQQLADAPEELRLTESAGLAEPSIREGVLERAAKRGIELREGEELLQIIRPCVGRGKGTRYYSPQVLEADAENWVGARMFANHLTNKQQRELEGLPRPIEHLAGRIRESWWDGEVPASSDGRYEQGGTYAIIKPRRYIREMLDDDPDLIESSINALATSIRAGTRDGQRVTVVEGIRVKPRTVDWVSEGGAGGGILRESAADEEAAVLDSIDDTELEEYLENERPGLLEALRARHSGDGGGDGNNDRRTEDNVPEPITPEMLREALSTDDGRAILAELVETPNLDGYVKADEVHILVESGMAERADLIRIEARGELERQIELRDLRDEAARLVEAAKLHPRLAKRITEQFSLTEANSPTEALAACSSDFDSEGNLVKAASDKLVEAVSAEIEDARSLMGELRPTRVRGQGDRRLVEASAHGKSESGDGATERKDGGEQRPTPKRKATSGSTLTDELLESAGFSSEELPDLWVNGL